MWTNNWKKWQFAVFAGQTTYMGSSSSYSYKLNYPAPILTLDGTSVLESPPIPTEERNNYTGTYYIPFMSFRTATVFFGTGGGTVTADDFALETALTDDEISVSTTRTFDESTLKYVFTTIVKNLTSSNVSISEVALYKSVAGSSSSNLTDVPVITSIASYMDKVAMFYREVLATPIVLAPAQTKTITLAISV